MELLVILFLYKLYAHINIFKTEVIRTSLIEMLPNVGHVTTSTA